jgi:hypothetical protein
VSPEILEAIADLRDRNLLDEPRAQFLSRVAGRRLVSIRFELQALLYAGVVLVVAASGVLVREHYRQIGPVAISAAIGLAAFGCLFVAARKLPPFSWGETVSPSVAMDYVLLLGALLVAADLAYVESQFRLLGADWRYHLLLVSALYIGLAYRYDSRSLLSLSLTSFAAWRGVSAATAARQLFGTPQQSVRANALFCGGLFLAASYVSRRTGRKAHFEPVYGSVGLRLLFGGLVAGLYSPGSGWVAWEAVLLPAAAAGAWLASRRGRSVYLAEAGIAGYAGLLRPAVELDGGRAGFLVVIAATALALMLLVPLFHESRRRAR